MSIYVLTGFFIDHGDDLEKLKVYESVLVSEEVPPRNSCDHLLTDVYLNKTQKYCSECGTKVAIIDGIPAKYRLEFVGYNPNFLNCNLKPEKKCGCVMCNNCECNECNDCDRCKCTQCKHCDDHDNSTKCSYHCYATCQPYPPDIFNAQNYCSLNDKECRCDNKYYEDYMCTCDMIDYSVPIEKIKGVVLKNGYRLINDNVFGFVILHGSYKVDSGGKLMFDFNVHTTVKHELETFANSLGIRGSFDSKIKVITTKPKTSSDYAY